MKTFRSRSTAVFAAALFIVTLVSFSGLWAGPQAQSQAQPGQQAAGEKKALTMEEYGRWRSITSPAISDDGQWACYIFRPREGDSTLYVRQLDSEKLYTIPIGSQGAGGRGAGGGAGGGPQFSDDSRWIAYLVSAPERAGGRSGAGRGSAAPAASTGRGGAQSAPSGAAAAAPAAPVRKLELLNLASGEKTSYENVASFSFVEGSRFLIIKLPKLDRAAVHNGTDMIIHRLDSGVDEMIGSVGEFAVNKGGALLAFTIDAADMTGNGISVLNLAAGTRRTLDSGKALYGRMLWDDGGTSLAVLKGVKKTGFVERENSLLAFKGLDKELERVEFKTGDSADFPKEMVISEKAALGWSEDVSKVFFGLKEQAKEPERRSADAPPIANVDIWHWKDDRIQAEQIVRANQDQNFTFRADYVLGTRKFVRLTDDSMRNITLTQNEAWGVGRDDRAYVSDWEEAKADYYRVNTTTGERTLMFKAQGATFGFSPDSRHFLYWKDGQVWDYLLDTGETRNLTQRSTVSFADKDYDHPGIKPSYRIAGFAKDGKGVVLNHKYDLYLQPYDASPASSLTGGTGSREEIRFRYQALEGEGEAAAVTRLLDQPDPDAAVAFENDAVPMAGIRQGPPGGGRGGQSPSIDLSKPVLLTAYGEWTKKAGYYELTGKDLKKLVFEDKIYGGITKAKKADRLLFTQQTFIDFPDHYLTDTKFSNPKRITDANPQQAEYKWGRRILFEFKNKKGVRLQGTLAIPDGYQQGQKLPMLVNFYEKNSQNLHRYEAPNYASSPQFAGFVSQGYLVMQPDIYFNTRTSHSDMLECVEAAVQKVIDMGYADPKRVGLHGHSYSGQGSAFISTQSKMFAAVVAGAAASDLVSDFNQIWKTSGTNQHRYDIYGQGRFGTNPYDDLQLYIDQSAVFHVRTMNTALLLLHGTDDGSVDWLQGVEFYNALRFNKKNVILLSYPGEAHGLRNLENQKDFLMRIQQFYDHYLKEKPAPDWMVNGVAYLKKAK
jgi:dienelactone hydrolase